MMRDEVFREGPARASDFEFNAEVASVFDDMITRSVPHYLEQQRMIVEIARAFWAPGTEVYDLGCSTATTLIALAHALEATHLVGYDNSRPMLEQAEHKIAAAGLSDRIALRHGDLDGDLGRLSLSNASVVTLCWTLQFVRPLRRDGLIRWIHDGLVDGGVLVVTDKILTANTPLNRVYVEFYYAEKRRRGYREEEIARKREALENVLIPYRVDENVELFRRNGFAMVEPFFQWFNFAGFLCLKRPR